MGLLNLATVLFVMTSVSLMTSSADKNVAKVRIYVDKMAVDGWRQKTGKTDVQDFKNELASVYFEINELFKTLKDNDVDLQLQIDNVIIMNENILNTNNRQIGTQRALDEFKEWVSPTYPDVKYDLAVLYTGADLISAYGYAFTKTVCSEWGLGVIEWQTTYMDALASAHELGHIFGSPHDGSGNGGCNGASGEIMNPVTYPHTPKHFFFSSCTAYSIKQKIDALNKAGKNCMSDWSSSGEIKAPRLGQLLSIDDVCKRGWGKDSYMVRSAVNENVCVSVWCMTDPQNNAWKSEATPQGLNCGKNKQCIQGKCVETSAGSPDVSDTCPFGDQPALRKQKTCSGLSGSECASYSKACCETCNDPGTPDEICKEKEGDDSSLGRVYYTNYGDFLCTTLRCLTGFKNNVYTARSHRAPEGMKCGKSKICRKGKCVTDKLGDPDMVDKCPYGDQPFVGGPWQNTCPELMKKIGCNKGWNSTCCDSCAQKDPGTADEVCRKKYGQNSALLRFLYDSNNYGDNLCSSLHCVTQSSNNFRSYSYYTIQAPEGMKCGKSKRCYDGRCVETALGDPNVLDSCPFGDQPIQAGVWSKNCKDSSKQQCSSSFTKKICCSTCS